MFAIRANVSTNHREWLTTSPEVVFSFIRYLSTIRKGEPNESYD